MGNKAVGGTPMIVKFVPVQFLTQQMCEEGILKDSALINI